MNTEDSPTSEPCIIPIRNSFVLKRKCREIGQSSPSMMWKRSIVQATAGSAHAAAALALLIAVCAVSSRMLSHVARTRCPKHLSTGCVVVYINITNDINKSLISI